MTVYLYICLCTCTRRYRVLHIQCMYQKLYLYIFLYLVHECVSIHMSVYLYTQICSITHTIPIVSKLPQHTESQIHPCNTKKIRINICKRSNPTYNHLSKNMHMHIYAYIHTSKILKHGKSHQEWHGNTCIVFVYIHIYVYMFLEFKRVDVNEKFIPKHLKITCRF